MDRLKAKETRHDQKLVCVKECFKELWWVLEPYFSFSYVIVLLKFWPCVICHFSAFL